ncbi:methyltransferase domain-containing protein [Opitutales bacterium]|nr:methyltransferase domain-containing protein [Opitutales bacterium]
MVKNIFIKLIDLLKYFSRKLGIEIKIERIPKCRKGLLNLNVACGSYEIPNFISLDYLADNYYSKIIKKKKKIHYDLRNDKLPFDDDSVDNIYISHAIEHVEDYAVENFLKESHRVLKSASVLRIAVPDSEFIYNVSKFNNNYWNWRYQRSKNSGLYKNNLRNASQFDYLLRELSTPKLECYKYFQKQFKLDPEHFWEIEYNDAMNYLKKGLSFREASPFDHINNWDFQRIREIGGKFGFSHILKSKCQGSVSKEMQGPIFDQNSPQFSLYVDLIK